MEKDEPVRDGNGYCIKVPKGAVDFCSINLWFSYLDQVTLLKWTHDKIYQNGGKKGLFFVLSKIPNDTNSTTTCNIIIVWNLA